MATKKLRAVQTAQIRTRVIPALALIGLGAAITSGTSGCATAKPNDVSVAASAAPNGSSARCVANAKPIHPLATDAAEAGGSSVALATVDGKTVAYVADADAKSVVAFDVDAKKVVASTTLSGTPAQVLVTNDGRVAVTLRDTSHVQLYNATTADQPLLLACEAKTAAEPIGVAQAKDGRLVVASGWGKKLSVFSSELEARGSVDLPREPRSVVVEGDRVFVSHMVGGQISIVDLSSLNGKDGQGASEKGTTQVALRGNDPAQVMATLKEKLAKEARAKKHPQPANAAAVDEDDIQTARFNRFGSNANEESCQGFALAKMDAPRSRVFAPEVFVAPGEKEVRTSGYGSGREATETASVAVLEGTTGSPIAASLSVSRANGWSPTQVEPRDHVQKCLLPRAAAVDAKEGSLLVACMGIDSIVAYDALAPNPAAAEKMRWRVSSGPNGIAVDSAHRRAVVFSSFDRSVQVIDLDSVPDAEARPVDGVALAPLAHPLSDEVVLGRALFHTTDDTRVSKDGRACASCHPDGRDDALTWSTPRGPRRSVLLAGRIATTAPYSWNADESSLKDHVTITFDRLNGGGMRGTELNALVAYISTLPAPPPLDVDAPDQIARGAAIFASADAACSSCHTPDHQFTDGTVHDVGSASTTDRDKTFGTPSLRFVSGAGPYFHDGRYGSLHSLLSDPTSKMGNSANLSITDRDALEAYVRTL